MLKKTAHFFLGPVKKIWLISQTQYRFFRYLWRFSWLDRTDAQTAFGVLRVNCHILDKALHIQPFQKGHSMRVYREVKRVITDPAFLKEIDPCDPAFLWCKNVYEQFEGAQNDIPITKLPESQERCSCRFFLKDKVSPECWPRIVEEAVKASNSCNRQSVRFYIVSSDEKIKQLIPSIAGATGFSNGIAHFVCVAVDLRPYLCIDDVLLPIIDAALALDAFSAAAYKENIAMTILNFFHATEKDRKNVERVLNLPAYERVIVFAAAGYPGEESLHKPPRMALNNFFKEIV